jgi:hypothetical protein
VNKDITEIAIVPYTVSMPSTVMVANWVLWETCSALETVNMCGRTPVEAAKQRTAHNNV